MDWLAFGQDWLVLVICDVLDWLVLVVTDVDWLVSVVTDVDWLVSVVTDVDWLLSVVTDVDWLAPPCAPRLMMVPVGSALTTVKIEIHLMQHSLLFMV